MADELISRRAAMLAVMRAGCIENIIPLLDAEPAVDAAEVVYCDKCIYSNSCEIEAMLLGDGIENPYCAGGERREENG